MSTYNPLYILVLFLSPCVVPLNNILESAPHAPQMELGHTDGDDDEDDRAHAERYEDHARGGLPGKDHVQVSPLPQERERSAL